MVIWPPIFVVRVVQLMPSGEVIAILPLNPLLVQTATKMPSPYVTAPIEKVGEDEVAAVQVEPSDE